MKPISVKAVLPKEVLRLQQIAQQTFYETFAPNNSEEDMRQYLAERFSLEQFLADLANPQIAFYLAWQEDQVLGYLKLNFAPAQTDLNDPQSLEIERIYVAASAQGLGLGKALLEKALEIAALKNLHYLWLGVWEQNTKAIAFYQKNGFEIFDQHFFQLGNDQQLDYLMKRPVVLAPQP